MKHQPEPRNNLGLVFEASGKFDEAVAEYAEARKLAKAVDVLKEVRQRIRKEQP